ncbi:MAG TPA: response regulator transcription factor [Vicinamibacterales bacterium]|nr:response regulator transcription factor [Vicinamibacterales bacterium]
MIDVAVLASNPIVRARLEVLVAAQPGLRLASSPFPEIGDRAPGTVDQPDVLLIEPGTRPIETVLRTLPPGPRLPPVVVVGGDVASVAVPRLLRAGVRAILPREVSAHEMAASIAAVAAGLVVLHPSGMPASISATRGAGGTATSPLTPRELEVLTMMAEGMGNRAIAHRLGISRHTVKFHIAAILDKLNARSRTEAVTVGLRLGMLMV